MTTLKVKVDEFVKLQATMENCKKELDTLKADFQAEGILQLETTKKKQVEIWGSNNAKIVVTRTESLKVPSFVFLKNILGEVVHEFAKEDIKMKYSAPFERILINLIQGDYVETSPEEIINQITKDEAQKKLLKKKLKGKFDKDIEHIMTICKMDKNDAEHYAYFLEEAFNNSRIQQLLSSTGTTPEGYETLVEKIKAAAIVDEGIKVGLELEA